MAFGMEALAAEPDLLVLGEMGIGNTTVAAAIYLALYGGEAADWVGRGTGVDDAGLKRKAEAVRAAVAPPQGASRRSARGPGAARRARDRRHGRRDPRGAASAARRSCSTASSSASAAAVLQALDPTALDHCLAGHVSAERAHRAALKRLGKTPLLDLGMRLGEGSGAALAVGIVKAAVACHNGMATFAEAGVARERGVPERARGTEVEAFAVQGASSGSVGRRS